MSSDKDKISTLANEAARRFGAEIIEYEVIASGSQFILRCVADYRQGGITIDVCSRINKKIVSSLQEGDILGSDFCVEVNSPGLDRQLKVKSDFLRVLGKVMLLWLNRQIEGKNFLEAKLLNIEDNSLVLESDNRQLKIDLSDIKTGKEKIEIR